YDYHVHSTISFDARVSLFEVCRAAVRIGAAGITFTEHVEFTRADEKGRIPDFGAYRRQIAAARESFPQLEIGMGLEIGMYAGRKGEIEDIVGGGDWDFVLASLHTVGGLCAYNNDFTRGKDKQYAFRQYFDALYQIIEEIPCFDVAAHLDMIRRNNSVEDRSLNYADYADSLDAILKLLIHREQGLEVNTAGWRFGLGAPHPHGSILHRYKELGGKIVTCGSDSHNERVCDRIDEGYQWMLQNGFRQLTLYRKRQPYFIDLCI
ncbi:MAG: histidinol-phosphatase HisJ family protein, partial [Clostridiales bacterium]